MWPSQKICLAEARTLIPYYSQWILFQNFLLSKRYWISCPPVACYQDIILSVIEISGRILSLCLALCFFPQFSLWFTWYTIWISETFLLQAPVSSARSILLSWHHILFWLHRSAYPLYSLYWWLFPVIKKGIANLVAGLYQSGYMCQSQGWLFTLWHFIFTPRPIDWILN